VKEDRNREKENSGLHLTARNTLRPYLSIRKKNKGGKGNEMKGGKKNKDKGPGRG